MVRLLSKFWPMQSTNTLRARALLATLIRRDPTSCAWAKDTPSRWYHVGGINVAAFYLIVAKCVLEILTTLPFANSIVADDMPLLLLMSAPVHSYIATVSCPCVVLLTRRPFPPMTYTTCPSVMPLRILPSSACVTVLPTPFGRALAHLPHRISNYLGVL